MKKLIFASAMALAAMSLVSAPTLRAQDSGQITIKDPAEFNAYQFATSQTDPKAKAGQLENFLTTYPQSVVKNAVLDQLMDTYQAAGDADKALGAASRLLQVDPNNVKAVFISVYIKKQQCGKTSDAQTCDDAAALARKGLLIPKPAATSDDDWKKMTAATFPAFHSAIALDDALAKKDFKAAIAEYRTELMLYPPEQTTSGPGLVDTLQLAEAYTKPDAKDLSQAVWFYCRAWNFAPAGFKPQIETKIEYWYKKFHGALDGLDAIKTQAAATLFPPGTFQIQVAKTPAEQIHDLLAATPDLNKLALADKETILAVGSKEDADKLWALLKDQPTPVPGIVIEATASVIKVAVTQDAKDAKTADFIVNMKAPLADKDIPAAGTEFKIQPGMELDGTYDSYTQIPATTTTTQAAEIVIRDGFIQPEKKKAAAPAHKPTAGHKAPAKK
jgi:tetratricopeptide (TPR) repeat protein